MDGERDPYLWRRHVLFARDLALRWAAAVGIALVTALGWGLATGAPVSPKIPQTLVVAGLLWVVVGSSFIGRAAELGSMAWGVDVRNERLVDPSARPARERTRFGVPASEQLLLSPMGEGLFVGLPLVLAGGWFA